MLQRKDALVQLQKRVVARRMQLVPFVAVVSCGVYGTLKAEMYKDLVAEMPEEISRVFSDYRMNLLQVGESERYHFDNEDVQDVFETARLIYKGEFDQVKEMFGDRTVKSDVGAMIGVMTDSDLIVERAYESKGGMNMCTALEKLEERGREAGRIEGREEGRKEGIAEGKREILFALLKAGAEIKLLKEVSGLSEEEIKTLRKEIE